jgi:hypothetical protein
MPRLYGVGEIEPRINAVLKAKIYATGHAAVVRGGGQKTLRLK